MLVAAGAMVAATAVWVLLRGARWAGSAALAAAAAAGGMVYLFSGTLPGVDVSHLPVGGQTLIGTVAGAPRYAEGLWRFVLDAESHEEGPRSEPVTGRLYVRLKSSQPVERGQRWRLTGKLRALREERNPGQRSEAARLASLEVTGVFTVGAEELASAAGLDEQQLTTLAHPGTAASVPAPGGN